MSQMSLDGFYRYTILLVIFLYKKKIDGTKNVSKVIFTLIIYISYMYISLFLNYFKVNNTVAAKEIYKKCKNPPFLKEFGGKFD